MELSSEEFKSGVGVEVVRGVGGLGSKRLELGSEEFGSKSQVGIREVRGVGGVEVGGIAVREVEIRGVGVGGTWGRKSRDQGD